MEGQWIKGKIYVLKRGGWKQGERKTGNETARRKAQQAHSRGTPLNLLLSYIQKHLCLEMTKSFSAQVRGASRMRTRMWGQRMLHVLGCETVNRVSHDVYWMGKLRFLQSTHFSQEIQHLLIPDKAVGKKHLGWCDISSLLETYLLFTEMILN